MDKAPDAFRTISEVADDLDVPQHVLRFWESRFSQIRPMKRAGGRRYYRIDDVELLRGIRHLLYGEGYTIRGVQRILKEQGAAFVQQAWRANGSAMAEANDDNDVASISATESNVDATRRREPRLERPSADGGERLLQPAAGARASNPAIAAEDRHKLQGVLHELDECRRLLQSVLG
ncbi:MAG TPA: MerR family transcriptional regulator [Xanthobacteraceae bacterium]|nr:MerR family transcriptional regulator [Xanthobacteraceae bacterium]